MLIVIEHGMPEPAHGNVGFRHHRQWSGRACGERMTLLAGFRPEELLGFGDSRVHPLLGSVDARSNGQRFRRERNSGFRFMQFGGVGGNIFLKFLDEKSVNDFRRVVRNAFRKPLVEQ